MSIPRLAVVLHEGPADKNEVFIRNIVGTIKVPVLAEGRDALYVLGEHGQYVFDRMSAPWLQIERLGRP